MLFFVILIVGVIILDGASMFLPESLVPLLYSEEEIQEESPTEEDISDETKIEGKDESDEPKTEQV